MPDNLVENIKRFAALGLDVALTELDIRYKLPGSADKQAKQAQDFAKAVSACMSVDRCVGVTTWGISDKHGWKPDEPGYGEFYMWDKDYKPKPAVAAVDKVLK